MKPRTTDSGKTHADPEKTQAESGYLKKEQVRIYPTKESDLPVLDSIHSEACLYFSFDPGQEIMAPAACYHHGDLPQGGSLSNFRMMTCFFGNTICGYLTLYFGYPKTDSLYICYLFIKDSYKKKGIGSAVVEMLCRFYENQGYDSAKVAVSLKNWGGIRFWHRCGFQRLTAADCPGDFSPEGYGCIELERKLL